MNKFSNKLGLIKHSDRKRLRILVLANDCTCGLIEKLVRDELEFSPFPKDTGHITMQSKLFSTRNGNNQYSVPDEVIRSAYKKIKTV